MCVLPIDGECIRKLLFFRRRNNRKILKISVFVKQFLLLGIWACQGPEPSDHIMSLYVEGQQNPVGVRALAPELSWELPSNFAQAKYQVQVASLPDHLYRNKPDLWDSGIKAGGETAIIYQGDSLEAWGKYYWRIKVWDPTGKMLLSTENHYWEPFARWDSPQAVFTPGKDSMHGFELHKSFSISKEVRVARANFSYSGTLRLFLNTHEWDPFTFEGDSVYSHAVTYALTPNLSWGENEVRIVLGPKQDSIWGGIWLEYADGNRLLIPLDSTWQ